MKENMNGLNQVDNKGILWLLTGGVLLFFTGGRFNFWPAAWLGNIFFIRFTRGRKPLPGYLAVGLVSWIIGSITWYGIQPIPLAEYLISMFVSILLTALPLLADRLLYRKVPAFAATLLFPLFSTALEYLFIMGHPMGSFGSIAYTQYANKPFIQLLSLTGLVGLSFMIYWFPAVVNHIWEKGWKVSGTAKAFLIIMVGILVFGSFRYLKPYRGETVNVTSIVRGSDEISLGMIMSAGDNKRYELSEKRLSNFIEMTKDEARGGTKIVCWPEATYVAEKEEFMKKEKIFKALAKKLKIYLFIPAIVIEENKPFVNRVSLYSPGGEELFTHIKFGGNSFEGSLQGDGSIKTFTGEYGTLSAFICWDMDFPQPLSQAGRAGVDILFSPANEWEEIVPVHAEMAVFRGIENGASTVHPASSGLSVHADPMGREKARLDWFKAQDGVIRSRVPVEGKKTLYSIIGESFSLLVLLATGAVILYVTIGSLIRKFAPPEK